MSLSCVDDVRITIGIAFVRGSAFVCRRTSMPSTLGSFKSSRITLGPSLMSRSENAPRHMMKSRASAPSRTTLMSLARLLALSACNVNSTSFGLSSTSRILTGSNSFIAVLQGEIESRSNIDCAVRPDFAAMALDDTSDQSQPDARSWKVLSPMQSLEYSEELVAVAHVKSDPVVFDEVSDGAALCCPCARA